MTNNSSFKHRFPHFGIFFVIAVTLAIPLTVWSLNNVNTNTKQHAQVLASPTPIPPCSNTSTNGYCPTGQKCSYNSNIGSWACSSYTTPTPPAPTKYISPTPKPISTSPTPAPTKYISPTPKPISTSPTPAPTVKCLTAPNWSGVLNHTDGATSVKYQYSLKNNCGSSTYINLTASRPNSGWNYQYSGCSLNTTCKKYISGGGSLTIYVTISRPSNATLGTYYISFKSALSANTSIYSTKTTSYIVTK